MFANLDTIARSRRTRTIDHAVVEKSSVGRAEIFDRPPAAAGIQTSVELRNSLIVNNYPATRCATDGGFAVEIEHGSGQRRRSQNHQPDRHNIVA